jgi:hypothetical protein
LPQTLTNQMTLPCFGCKSGPITCTLNLAKSGYLIGEAIAVNAEISNNSYRKMTSSEIVLVEEITYKDGRGMTDKTIIKLLVEMRGPIPAGGNYAWNNVQILIPNKSLLNLTGCRLISVNYWLVVR